MGQSACGGLRQDATLFDEIIIDVNTMYFERKGGYDYAREFYAEAVRFLEDKFGAGNVISAVMHADEINRAASDELGKDVYHYHLHAVVLPVVEKEILWSKRCKDPALRGTVKRLSIRSATPRSGLQIFPSPMNTVGQSCGRTASRSTGRHTASCKMNCSSICGSMALPTSSVASVAALPKI